MRVPIASLVSGGFGVALAAGMWLSGWSPWPVVVMAADLSRFSAFAMLKAQSVPLAVPLIGSALVYLLVRVLRLLLRRPSAKLPLAALHVAAWIIVLGVVVAYPETKEAARLQDLQRCTSPPVVTLVDRHAEYEEPRVRGLVVVPDGRDSAPALPVGWPYSLLDRSNTLYVSSSRETVRIILRELQDDEYFEFPEQLNPRESLDHAARYVAYSCGDEMFRVFGRLADPGGVKLWSLQEAILGPLNLSTDWWKRLPGYRQNPRSAGGSMASAG